MGLNILQEFRPITPIRTVPTAKSFKQSTQLCDVEVEKTKEVNKEEEEQEECHTPKSPSQMLKTPLVCPPAPKKPRLTPRNYYNLAPPPWQGFFQVPDDLASVFVILKAKPSNEIKGNS